MTRIEETPLPGVGIRHDFVTKEGERLGVITHRSGRRELLIYDSSDPDACRATLRLDDEDVDALQEILGGSNVVAEHLAGLQQVEGIAIDWLAIGSGASCADRRIGDFRIEGDTGVSIVAVVRDGRTVPAPPPEFELRPGDTAVAVGTPQGLRQAFARLTGD